MRYRSIFQTGGTQEPIHNVNAVEFLASLQEPPNLILTDPPYGMSYRSNIPGDRRWNASGEPVNGRFDVLKGDAEGEIDMARFLSACHSAMDEGFLVMFSGIKMFGRWSEMATAAGFELRTPGVWIKGCANGGDLTDPLISVCEMVICARKGKPRSFSVRRNGEDKTRIPNYWNIGRVPKAEYCGHPTQKPLLICQDMVEMFTSEGGFVVDPFCGSGSSLVAAKMSGRRYAGADVDAHYADLARDRLSRAGAPAEEKRNPQ